MRLQSPLFAGKKYLFLSFLVIIVFSLLSGCGKKTPVDVHARERKSPRKRILYHWDLNVNSACFLLQGKRKCGQARLVKLTDTLYSIRINVKIFHDFPLLKFTLRDINTGKKKAPDADVSYQEANILYTNFDYAGASFLELFHEGSLLKGSFSFRIRSKEGKWLNFTQGTFIISI